MKKILLIIALTFCIFQVVVLATVIDIGAPAINRSTDWGGGRTVILKDNPANLSGTITSIEIWAYHAITSCEVATFYVVSGNNLSTRDWENIGNIGYGYKVTKSVNLDVEEGDYIGIKIDSSGDLSTDKTGGAGMWYKTGDYIPCTDVLFSSNDAYILSLYGTGVTGDEEGDNAIFFGANF